MMHFHGANRRFHFLLCATVTVWLLGSPESSLADSGPAQTGWVASANSASAGLFNPAGLTHLERAELEVGLMGIRGESDYEITATDVTGTRTDEQSGTLGIPAVYYARPLADRWSLGLSFAALGGIGTKYDQDWAGRYFMQEWSLGYGGLTGSVAWQASSRWSVGLGISLAYALYHQESAIFNPEPDIGDGQLVLDADGIIPTATLGVLWEPVEDTRVGAVFTSEGDPELTGTPEVSNLGPTREAGFEARGVLDREFEVNGTLPARALLGFYHERPSGKAFSVDLLWMDFSEYLLSMVSAADSSLVDDATDYQDMFGGSVGARFPAGEKWKLLAGAMYVSSGVKDESRTFTLRADEFWGAGVGFQRELGPNHSLGVNLNYYRVGDAPVTTDPLPVIGSIEAEYTKNSAFMIDTSWQWRL